MDVKKQEYFIAIVEEGSLSAAAHRLYISQPTLSQFLHKLEQDENTQLLIRGRNNAISLTEAGKLYYESAKEILRIRNEYQRKLSDLVQTSERTVVFGAASEHGMSVLLQITKLLSEKYKDQRIVSRHYTAQRLQSLVARGEIDVAFSAYNEKNPKFDYIDFRPSEIVLVLAKDHPLAHLGSAEPAVSLPHLPLSRFRDLPIATYHQHTPLRDTIDRYCRANGIELDIRYETLGVPLVLDLAESGACGGLCPYRPSLDAARNLVYIGLDPPTYYATGIYYNKNSYHTRFMKDFLRAGSELASRDRADAPK